MGGIKIASVKNNQLISLQRHHFSPRSTAKTNDKGDVGMANRFLKKYGNKG